MAIRYLVIEGNIGAGKTSLCQKIADRKNAKLILEQFAENPFLPKFYENPERYSFSLELSFLADRYKQLKKELDNYDLFSELIVSDYYFVKSLLFASSTLDEDEYNLYRQLFDIIYSRIPTPDLYVYLHKSADSLLKNIKTRGREYEQSISRDYLLSIEKEYFKFFKQHENLKILLIDTNNLDFVNNDKDYKSIEKAIFSESYSNGITNIIL